MIYAAVPKTPAASSADLTVDARIDKFWSWMNPGFAAITLSCEISTALDSGKHTTTHATLYRLDERSALIDSPGLQEFGLSHLDATALEHAFPELRTRLGECRFRDCRHNREPGCAVRAALDAGAIDARRYAVFRSLRDALR
mgnify:CR=1 FL=1